MDCFEELLQFLTPGTRLDLKVLAVEQILGLTGKMEGRTILLQAPQLIQHLTKICDEKVVAVARDACLALVNLSADEEGALTILSDKGSKAQKQAFVRQMVDHALNPQSVLADPALMVLSNITRPSRLTNQVLDIMAGNDEGETLNEEKICEIMERLITALTSTEYNTVGANLHYLGPLLSNLSQLPIVRRYILNHEQKVIHKLIPFTQYKPSLVRRGGIVGCLRNCCFDVQEHAWLLGPDVDILPHLLLPLAGPEEFDDEDNNKLPVDLQWLPEDKEREIDPDIRCMLIEALEQLCATRVHREFMRDHNVYLILRELHKWEKDRQVLLACENLVDLLIRKEEEIGEDNLYNVEVPEDLIQRFEKMDKEFLEDP